MGLFIEKGVCIGLYIDGLCMREMSQKKGFHGKDESEIAVHGKDESDICSSS